MHNRAFGWLLAAAGAALTCNPALAGPTCLPDIDGSGDVGTTDLLDLLANWGPCDACPADINSDGVVDILDLLLLLECWGLCPCRPPVIPEVFDATEVVDVTDATSFGLGLVVTHVYATGSTVAVGDALLLARANLVPTVNTNFYQDLFGNDLPPTTLICNAFPSVCYDTFVTMREVVDDATPVGLVPGFSMRETSINGDWFVSPTEIDRQAVDISGVTGNPGQAGVLIAQITLVLPPPAEGPSSVGFAGDIRMWASGAGGDEGAQSMNSFIYCPWDCQPQPDGFIGINDFLELLAQWSNPEGGSCDYDYDGEIGIDDFLDLLSRKWGPCPG